MNLSANRSLGGMGEDSEYLCYICLQRNPRSLNKFSLMQSATNIKMGRREDRSLLCVSPCPGNCFDLSVLTPTSLSSTGIHTVADVYCVGCNERIGWFYHKAADISQKYKEGGFRFAKKKISFMYLAHWKFI